VSWAPKARRVREPYAGPDRFDVEIVCRFEGSLYPVKHTISGGRGDVAQFLRNMAAQIDDVIVA
jgi:hypothetical protein